MGQQLQDLLTRAAQGDPQAKDALLQRLYPDVAARVHDALARDFRPKRGWLLPLFSTSDIVQDVFLGVIGGLEGFAGKSEDELRAWIATQVRNRIVDRLRFHQAQRRDVRRNVKPRDSAGDTVLPGAGDPTPSVCAALDERARLLAQALDELSPRDRELWCQRFEEELSHDAIASRLGYANAESARAACRALRAKLAVRLRRLGIETSGAGGAP
jgi:RNA polymerase sigma factor (sigma-70 family)